MKSPPGIETLMTEFRGRVYTLPGGRRDCAVRLPIRICRRTGTVGGTKLAPLMANLVPLKLKARLMALSTPPWVGLPGWRKRFREYFAET